MRIDKFICDTINITRTQAKSKISAGSVTVNGQRIKSNSTHINEKTAVVAIDGNVLSYRKYVYIMMNKPKGVISASKDTKCKTAVDLLSDTDKRHDLFIAGRLDKDTTGFLLITNDGDFAHSILSPKRHVFKKYLVTLELPCQKDYGQAFENGIVLSDGYKCKTAEYTPISDNMCCLKISEGKFHQIKRMFAALGNNVIELSRIAIGGVELDKSLKTGEYRYLTVEEMNNLLTK